MKGFSELIKYVYDESGRVQLRSFQYSLRHAYEHIGQIEVFLSSVIHIEPRRSFP
jgi:hypothetical protein